jgi:CRP-like cAMP-binding protein
VGKKDFQSTQAGERTNLAGKPVSNRVLLSVSDREYRAIRPHLEYLRISQQLSLYEPNDPLEFVYFPNAGMVSLVIETEDGRTVEVGEVGKEGFAGIPAAVGMCSLQLSASGTLVVLS